MSRLLQSNSTFLHFLLETSKRQALLILQNTTPEQALVISEVALNLLHLPLTPKEERRVHHHKVLLKKLSKKKITKKAREKIISKNKNSIYDLFKVIQESLFKLI